jgi:hypothetical protein
VTAVAIRDDPGLAARVVRTTPLVYDAPPTGHPAHVRAGSGLCWFQGRLAVVQDDAAFLALVDPVSLRIHPIPLPAFGGLHEWTEAAGTKPLKPDLEAIITLGADTLLAFGSGSRPPREVVLLVDGDAEWRACPELYALLRAEIGFSGSELNIEGAVVLGDTVRLFNRGNGAPRGGLEPVDASCELDLDALLACLRDGAAPPVPRNVRRYDLGAIEGCRLGFTDVALAGDVVLFSAAAEQSPDVYRDGPVIGSVIGRMGEATGWCPLTHADGAPFVAKVEGIAGDPQRPRRLWAVVDHDDPAMPSDLCEIELFGF